MPVVRLITQTTSPKMARIQRLPPVVPAGSRFPPTLVVAGADPRPRGQVFGTGEPTHINADLATQRCRGRGADPRDGLQELARFRRGLQIHRDLLLDLHQFVVHAVDVLEDLAHEEAMMGADPALERLAQGRKAPPPAPPGVRGPLRGLLLATDQRFQPRPPTDP